MKQYFIYLLALFGSSSVFSQEAKFHKPLSLELSIGYEKIGFNNNYQNYYFWEDGNFPILSEKANKTSIGLKTSLNVNRRNTLFFGLSFNYYRAMANNKKVINSFIDFEFGHRIYALTIYKFDIYFKNSLNFEDNNEINKYNLKGINLIWKTGLHLEKTISEKINLVIGMNYGLGLNNTSTSERYFLRTNLVGFNIGIKKQL